LTSTNNDTYLLPHVDPDGVVYTSLINYDAEQGGCCVDVLMDYSKRDPPVRLEDLVTGPGAQRPDPREALELLLEGNQR
jgi:hypothetical protein